eukprot:1080517-Alexandrium_andersonii.AAC.1
MQASSALRQGILMHTVFHAPWAPAWGEPHPLAIGTRGIPRLLVASLVDALPNVGRPSWQSGPHAVLGGRIF